jgi:GTPase-activating protein SAC7
VEGIFRLSGSAKRIKDLQGVFNSPDKYGKGLDWTGYTVHDAANILRRYLNQLPEPIIPLSFYDRFREPLRPYLAQSPDGEATFDLTVDQHAEVVHAYQKLITELPPLNKQLLLYILDLLAVFSSKADRNRMTAANLAAIFQPGILSHPQHDMVPNEYRLSQDVLIFLIENQDHFLFGMSGTGIDEKTKQDVESGVPSVKSPKSAMGRSASNASAGADSLRKFGVRRNVSVGSRGSRDRGSPNVSSPGTPTGLTQLSSGSASGGIARSNTLPSKRSPAISSGRFQRTHESVSAASPIQPEAEILASEEAIEDAAPDDEVSTPVPPTQKMELPPPLSTVPNQPAPPAHSGHRDRKISNLFGSRSPLFAPIDPQGKKLKKRRGIPGSANESAQSSQASLPGDENAAFQTPLMTPDLNSGSRTDPMRASPSVVNTASTPVSEHPTLSPTSAERTGQGSHLHPNRSPAASVHSRSSVTDHSEFDTLDRPDGSSRKSPPTVEKEKRRHRWRISSSAKKGDDFPLAPPPRIGDNPGAGGSNSSIGSAPGKAPRKSFTGDSQATTVASGHEGPGSVGGNYSSIQGPSSHESAEALKDSTNNGDEKKGGFLSKWIAKRSEKKVEKEAEKERAKSPPRSNDEAGKPRSSLSAFAQEHFGPNSRGRGSFDRSRGGSTASEGVPPTAMGPPASQEGPGGLETVKERPGTEGREKEGLSGMTPVQGQTAPAPEEREETIETSEVTAVPTSQLNEPASSAVEEAKKEETATTKTS